MKFLAAADCGAARKPAAGPGFGQMAAMQQIDIGDEPPVRSLDAVDASKIPCSCVKIPCSVERGI